MRNRLLFCVLFAPAIVLLGAVIVGALDVGALDRPDRDVIGYNVLSERVFKGIVASKGHIIEGLMYFPLRTTNTMMEVQIGPKEFVERSGFKLNAGDMVTVIGMPVVMKERQVVLAREVSSMNGVLIVRDRVGLPLWEKDRPILMDPERRIRFFDECAVIK
jgi:hypothetical protein